MDIVQEIGFALICFSIAFLALIALVYFIMDKQNKREMKRYIIAELESLWRDMDLAKDQQRILNRIKVMEDKNYQFELDCKPKVKTHIRYWGEDYDL